MRIEYEISEQDFMRAQELAIKHSPVRLIRWTRWVLPLFGLCLLVFVIEAVVKQGFSPRVIPGVCFCLLFISLPLLSRRKQKKLYGANPSMHGKLSVEVSDQGLQFQGPTSSSHAGWSHFRQFFEDKNSFVLYQHSQIFNLIPKRCLTPDQIASLRGYLDRNIGSKAVAKSAR